MTHEWTNHNPTNPSSINYWETEKRKKNIHGENYCLLESVVLDRLEKCSIIWHLQLQKQFLLFKYSIYYISSEISNSTLYQNPTQKNPKRKTSYKPVSFLLGYNSSLAFLLARLAACGQKVTVGVRGKVKTIHIPPEYITWFFCVCIDHELGRTCAQKMKTLIKSSTCVGGEMQLFILIMLVDKSD